MPAREAACCLDLVTVNGSSNSVSVLRNDWSFPQPMTLQRAVSAASGTAIVAPGALATLFGRTSATVGLAASTPWPMRLGGISLEILDNSGTRRLAPLIYVPPRRSTSRCHPSSRRSDLRTSPLSTTTGGPMPAAWKGTPLHLGSF
jgi:hypothetical protein